MRKDLDQNSRTRLERSCGASSRDWIRLAQPQPGLDRLEAFFAGHAYDPHRHDTYAIGYTLGGVQSFDYRGARWDSTRENVIVLHPDEVHNGRAGAETGFAYKMIYIAPRLIREALGEKAASLPFAQNAVSSDPRLLGALCPALRELDRDFEPLERDQIVLGIAEALLALDDSARRASTPRGCDSAVDRAQQFLDSHFARVVSSEELEAITGLDRYALARQFRVRLGTSPYRYLTMRRLDHARASLRAGHKLAETALASGFVDQSHMTRQFKRAYGLPPGRWQALHIAC